MSNLEPWETELQWRNNSNVAGWFFKKWLYETGRQPWPKDYREVRIVTEESKGISARNGHSDEEQKRYTQFMRDLQDNAALANNKPFVTGLQQAKPKTQRRESIHPVSWCFPPNVRKHRFGIYHDHILNRVREDESIYDVLTSRFYRYARRLDIDELASAATGIMEGARFEQVDGVWYRVYMARWILKTPWFMIRIHKFLRGDDDSAPHDHPFSFITFPLTTYTETVEMPTVEASRALDDFEQGLFVVKSERDLKKGAGFCWVQRTVRRFRFHKRPATYRHFVHEPKAPFWTIVLSSGSGRDWGLWLEPDVFDSFKNWAKY